MSLTPIQVSRYARHIVLREIGGPGQNALLNANVALVGAGGLGGPAGLYLAAAGLGRITLIDDDVVDLSNLQRQVQFETAEVGQSKVSAMAARLTRQNPDCRITQKSLRLTEDNAQELLSRHDVILDGTDRFATRFAVNAASHALGLPLVSGALGRFDLQLGVFNATPNAPCYRCFVRDVPEVEQNCATEGVLGALAGMCGSMMAIEAIKLITEAGEPLSGKLFIYDSLKGEGRTIGLSKDPNCPACA